jgi:hypothetical protein
VIEQTAPPRGSPAGGICLVTALRDPSAELIGKAEPLWEGLRARFDAIAMNVTDDTHPDWLAFLAERAIPVRTSAPDWDRIGAHRRGSLAAGLEHFDREGYLYADPDHILRWLERDPEELDRILDLVGRWDCLVVGRSPSAFAATPERLRMTEAVVNRVYALMTGRPWDLMMAARGFSQPAAAFIARQSTEDTIGNDVAWPLQLERAGFSLAYTEADGLTYETNTVYARRVTDHLDEDPAAWMLRVYAAGQHIDAMRPYLAGPGAGSTNQAEP